MDALQRRDEVRGWVTISVDTEAEVMRQHIAFSEAHPEVEYRVVGYEATEHYRLFGPRTVH